MFEFLEIANEIIILLAGLIGFIGTGIGTYYAIKNWITAFKTKTEAEKWALIMEMADAAMTEAEESNASGETKKQMVMDSLMAAMAAAGMNILDFTEQLSLYIDQTIDFVNKMKKK